MVTRITVSVPDDKKDVLEWLETQVDNRRFRNRSQGVVECVEMVKDNKESEFNV